MISVVCSIVNSVRKSVNDTQIVWERCGLRLKARNETRWNSELYMLLQFLRALDLDPLLLTRLNCMKKKPTFTASQLVILKEIVALLEPFEHVSDGFQADFETIGMVIPGYLGLLNHLTLTIKDRSGVEIPNPQSPLAPLVKKCKATVAAFRESLKRRFGFNEDAVLEAVKLEIDVRYRAQRKNK